MGEYLPRYHDPRGNSTTRLVASDVTGGQLVMLDANGSVLPATAAAVAWDGIAAYDAKVGQRVTVFKGGVQRPIASGPIAPGDMVVAAAGGKVVKSTNPAAGTLIGIAESAAADGARADVRFER